MSALTIHDALHQAQKRLAALEQCQPALEAAALLGHCLDRPRSFLVAWPERALTAQQERCWRRLLSRRLGGEPLAYILGQREFWSLPLEVSADTLIPRPETELLVERALARLPAREPCAALDLGTGSGAVAAALASERPAWHIVATDRSASALAVARRNFRRLHLRNVRCVHGDWLDTLPARVPFRLIVSNPPYVAANDPHLRRGDLPHEPADALVGGADGLRAIRRIVGRAPEFLDLGGWLMLEHGSTQGPAVRNLMREQDLRAVRTYCDLAGLERVTEGTRTT